MNTTFIISGGAGRVLCAIPALEKFHRLNPEDNFNILIFGWESLYWGHPLLQKRTFSATQKGIFDNYIKNNNLVIPEPYERKSYYTQQKSMIEVFDEIINNTNTHEDLDYPNLFLQSHEINSVNFFIETKKQEFKKNKVIVFQPYGSGIKLIQNRPFDVTARSLDVDDYLRIVKKLSNDFLVIFFGEKEYVHYGDDVSWKPCIDMQIDLRFWISCIYNCDYFVGVDSFGQHVAKSFNKPGTVIMGSTFEKNVTYPDHFNIFRNNYEPTYSPIRISPVDCDFSDRINENCMTFSSEEIDKLCESIKVNCLNIKGNFESLFLK